jgi:hypothetical protein
MKPWNRLLALLGLTLSCLPAWADAAAGCEQKYQDIAERVVKLPYWEFDQTEAGWRQLGDCPAQQARLLQRYARRQAGELRNVRWHLAQALAMAGDNAAAAEQAELAVNPDEARQHPDFNWNAYVLATAAFLRGHRADFDRHFEVHRRAAGASPENEVNFKVLVGLARCFGKPYGEAYGACRPD